MTALLEIDGLKKRLGGRWVLDGVSLAWKGPGALVVMGENGAGKSTLLRVVAGILSADEGTVRIAGEALPGRRVQALRHVGYAPEASDLPPHLTAAGLVSLVAALKEAPRPPATLVARLGVGSFLDQPLAGLSLGQRRRATVLAALTGDPELLVMDEPTNGLDTEGAAVLVSLLREREERGLSALVATHDRSFVDAVARSSLELANGRLAPSGLLRDGATERQLGRS
jgi:ABC-type multidrug transport system ATPase subunit